MAEHFYECLFLLDPNKSSADWDGSVRKVNGIIERHGGAVVETRHWAEPKLAYPIKKFRKGSYLLTYFTAAATKIHAMEAECRLNELILRQLVIKHHPRIAHEIRAHLAGENGEAVVPVAVAVAAAVDRPAVSNGDDEDDNGE